MTIYIGLDDTDTRDHPGTNKLARHLAMLLAPRYQTEMIVRHQLLCDPRVPCTNKNGCVAMLMVPQTSEPLEMLIAQIERAIIDWAPPGSDPGLCVTNGVPAELTDFGHRCQRELVTQDDARMLAARHNVCLAGLGGTHDGVIGALAAVGLVASGNDGRVVHRGDAAQDAFGQGSLQSVDWILARGVDEVCCIASGRAIQSGVVDLGKRLRPNLRRNRVVLYVERDEQTANLANCWNAVRVV